MTKIAIMMVIGKKTKKMVLEPITLVKEDYTTDNGNKIKLKEWVFIIGQTVKYTPESTKMERNTATEFINSVTRQFIQVISTTENNIAWVFL